jgi:hypothetical protein
MINLKTLMIFIFCAFLCVGAQNFQPIQREPGARLVLEEDNYDYGEVFEGTVVTYDFKFTNAGSDTLVIKKVGTS